jgi:hypothetical protein
MDDMDRKTVDLHQRLGPRIEPPLRGPPVVLLGPVPAELTDLRAGKALNPPGSGGLVRPTRRAQSPPKVVDGRGWN